MLQNKIVLGVISAIVVISGALFVAQPTKAYADANMQFRQENAGIAVFGTVKLTDGSPLADTRVGVGVEQGGWSANRMRDNDGDWQRGNHDGIEVLDSTVSGRDGTFKLWVSSHDAQHLRGQAVLLVHPSGGQTYVQDVDLMAGSIASVQIKMSTPLIPILPFPVFTY